MAGLRSHSMLGTETGLDSDFPCLILSTLPEVLPGSTRTETSGLQCSTSSQMGIQDPHTEPEVSRPSASTAVLAEGPQPFCQAAIPDLSGEEGVITAQTQASPWQFPRALMSAD